VVEGDATGKKSSGMDLATGRQNLQLCTQINPDKNQMFKTRVQYRPAESVELPAPVLVTNLVSSQVHT